MICLFWNRFQVDQRNSWLLDRAICERPDVPEHWTGGSTLRVDYMVEIRVDPRTSVILLSEVWTASLIKTVFEHFRGTGCVVFVGRNADTFVVRSG